MSTVRLRIDGREVDVPARATLREAAAALGGDIPALCHREGYEPSASCLACAVLERGSGRTLPACAARPAAGMQIETAGPAVEAARRTAVELLLGDHAGDCEAPCRRGCPAGVDVPLLIRQAEAGDWGAAARTLKAHLALPGSLTHICSVPCERSCRRGRHDAPLAICLIERAAADADLRDPWLPPAAPPSGKRVAIAGAGPAGLTAAYFLQQFGHACTLLEREAEAGGVLRAGGPEGAPPWRVLSGEIDVIRRLGARLETGRELGRDAAIDELLAQFDAVVIATGAAGAPTPPPASVAGRPGLFAAGGIVRPVRHVALAAAQGRAAAFAVHAHLAGREPDAGGRRFSSVIGTLRAGEMEEFLRGADPSPPVVPAAGRGAGFSAEEAAREARRCLRCDCRKKDACRLREGAERLGAVQRRYSGRTRPPVRIVREHPEVVHEPGKCIRCGLCIQAAARAGEPLGLAFLGKGLDVRVGAPFGATLAAALRSAARECAMVCPTGAFSLADPRRGR